MSDQPQNCGKCLAGPNYLLLSERLANTLIFWDLYTKLHGPVSISLQDRVFLIYPSVIASVMTENDNNDNSHTPGNCIADRASQ